MRGRYGITAVTAVAAVVAGAGATSAREGGSTPKARAAAVSPSGAYPGRTSQGEPFALRVGRLVGGGKNRPIAVKALRFEFQRPGCTSGAFLRHGRLAPIYFGPDRSRRGRFRFRSRPGSHGPMDILIKGRMRGKRGSGTLKVGVRGRCSMSSSPLIRWTVRSSR